MIKIFDKKIGLEYKPFIIAEMSGNHNQSLERALKIVDAAAESGVDALKIQTYTADTLTLNVRGGDFFIDNKDSLWEGKSLYELYEEAYTPWEWHAPIIKRATELGLICFSTPFDSTAVDFLEDLNMPAYKIASFENTHLPLIKKVAAKGKPMIISTGMASIAELDETVQVIRGEGCENFVLLKCTSTYPATPDNSNILTIPHMRNLFGSEVGLSDHTMGVGAAVAAVAHGATVIEKHFTLSRADGGVDSDFSLEPNEMSQLVIETKRAWESLGRISYGITDSEKNSITFRSSIYISEDIKKGEVLTENNIRIVRPGKGLAPKYINLVLGKKAKENYNKGTALTWGMIE